MIGSVALLLGGLFAWASPNLFSSPDFAARARQALDDSPALRRLVARSLVVSVIEQRQADLIAFRPLLVSVAEPLVGSDAFGNVFELAVRNAHRFVVEEPVDSVLVRSNEAALLLIDTVRKVAPAVADAIPVTIEPTLLRLRDLSSELAVWRTADRVRYLGTVLPLVGILAWAFAIALSRDRHRMLANLGMVLGALGLAVLAWLRIGGRAFTDRFELALEQEAASTVWKSFTSGLAALAWLATLAGVVLMAAVRALSEGSRVSPARLRAAVLGAVTRLPRNRTGRGLAAVALAALGLGMLIWPLEVAAVAVATLGAFTFYCAIVLLITVLLPADAGHPVAPRRRRRAIVVVAAAWVILVVPILVYLAAGRPEVTAGLETCNGRIEYCSRRLDQVAFPTTHNSMTAADDGFLLPNQEQGIAAQLRDGVRGFQIDAYLGSVRESGGTRVVYTDLSPSKFATISAQAGPELARQAVRFRTRVGPPRQNARQDVYLCHNFCELGAVLLSDELDVFRRFLERNPTEVLFIVIQDELPARALTPVLTQSGIDRYLATIDPSRRLPTLGSLIASGNRLVVGLENGDLGPRIPNVFSSGLLQEVPYNYRTVADLKAGDACRPLRGHPDAPLFQFNHWVTPASLNAARQVNARAFLLARAERCAAQRHRLPNLVSVDFYETGDLFPVVEQLNAGE